MQKILKPIIFTLTTVIVTICSGVFLPIYRHNYVTVHYTNPFFYWFCLVRYVIQFLLNPNSCYFFLYIVRYTCTLECLSHIPSFHDDLVMKKEKKKKIYSGYEENFYNP